jgi:4'-phosphopantetheinyl transferase EntD
VIGLGFDAECSGPLEARLHNLICLSDELAHFETLPFDTGHADWPKLAFSAKEAFYKLYRPIGGVFLDFHDARIWFSVETERSGTFTIDLRDAAKPRFPAGTWFEGRWRIDERWIFVGASLRARSVG